MNVPSLTRENVASHLQVPIPERPHLEELKQIQEWKWSVKKAEKINLERHSLRCDTELKLSVSGPHLDEKQVRSIVDEIKQVLTASSTRKHERAERAKEEDFDAEERELLKEENEHEEDLFYQVGDCLGTLIKTFRTSFLPFFDELSSYITPMFAAVYGVGVCVEFGGSVFKPLVGETLSRLDTVIRHPNAQLPDNVMAYDNVVSALGKICQFHRD